VFFQDAAGVDRHALLVTIGAKNAVYEDLKHPRFIGDSRSGYFFLLVGYGPDFVSSGFQKKKNPAL
jgi:hypothetical protein